MLGGIIKKFMKNKIIIILLCFVLLATVSVSYLFLQQTEFPYSQKTITKKVREIQKKINYTIYLPQYIPDNLYINFIQSKYDTTFISLATISNDPQINMIIHPISWKEQFLKGPYVGERVYLEEVIIDNFNGEKYLYEGRPGLYINDAKTFISIGQSYSSAKQYDHDDLIKIIQSLYKP